MFALTPQERMARPKTVKFIVGLNFLSFHTVWAKSGNSPRPDRCH